MNSRDEERLAAHVDRPAGTHTSPYGLVAALFQERKHATDAISDLIEAGFPGRNIRLAYAFDDPTFAVHPNAAELKGPDIQAADGHSLRWRMRHKFEDDLHKRGADQLSGEDADDSHAHQPPYEQVTLHDTLAGLGVMEDRITLLNREIGPTGAFLLVDGSHRWKDVVAIVERNCGDIRTDTATEQSHSNL